jgi:hypothetical protein
MAPIRGSFVSASRIIPDIFPPLICAWTVLTKLIPKRIRRR